MHTSEGRLLGNGPDTATLCNYKHIKGTFANANGVQQTLSSQRDTIVHLDTVFIPASGEDTLHLSPYQSPRDGPEIYIIKSTPTGSCICKAYKTLVFCHWVKVIQFDIQLTRSARKLSMHPGCSLRDGPTFRTHIFLHPGERPPRRREMNIQPLLKREA